MNQPGSINSDAEQSLLDHLLTDSRLYTQSKDYKELLDFVLRLRNFWFSNYGRFGGLYGFSGLDKILHSHLSDQAFHKRTEVPSCVEWLRDDGQVDANSCHGRKLIKNTKRSRSGT